MRYETKVMINDERGSIFLWLGVTVFLALTTLGYLYFNNARLAAYTHLQAIAEAAAIAGAQKLCPADGCLEQAYQAAVTTINHNFSLQNNGYERIELNDDFLPPVEITEPSHDPYKRSYTSKRTNLEVQIYPGWLSQDPNDTDIPRFSKLDNQWLADNPGIPPQLVMNSFVVEIKLIGLTSVVGFPIGGSDTAKINGRAIARSGPNLPVAIAPFAIPACALISEEGKFEQEEICYGDRLFTQSDRYLPKVSEFLPFTVSYEEALKGIGPFVKPANNVAESYLAYYEYQDKVDAETKRLAAFKNNQFGVRPSFFYGPCSKDINECNIKRKINYSLDQDNSSFDGEYATFGGWTNYAYSHISDHYGVVGHTNSSLNEGKLIYLLKNKIKDELFKEDYWATIGQAFYVWHDGLKLEDTGNMIWDKLIKSGDPSYFFGTNSALINNEITMSSNRALGLASLPNFPNLEVLPDQPLPYPTLAPSILPVVNPVPSGFSSAEAIFFNDARMESNSSAAIDTDRYPTLLRDQFSNGLCNSKRMRLDCGGKTDILDAWGVSNCTAGKSEQATHFGPSYSLTQQEQFVDYAGQTFTLKSLPKDKDYPTNNVWQAKVPIIAEDGPNARPCIIGANKAKPSINNDSQYVVIGFVDVDIFDLDIGTPPVEPPALQTYSFTTPIVPLENTNNPELSSPDYHDYHLKHYQVSADIKIPAIPDNPKETTLPGTGPNPWIFQIDDPAVPTQTNTPIACNLVRARVACDNNFISSSQNHGPRRAELVSASLIPNTFDANSQNVEQEQQ